MQKQEDAHTQKVECQYIENGEKMHTGRDLCRKYDTFFANSCGDFFDVFLP